MGFLKPLVKSPVQNDSGKWIRRLFPAVIFVVYVWLLMQSPLTSRWVDFPVYWDAGKKAVLGFTVYDVSGHFQYKYSPLIALLFGKLFQAMSFETASWVFQKSMLILWLSLFLKYGRRDYKVIFIALLFFGNALRLDLELGQINALVFYLFTMMCGNLEKECSVSRDFRFGLLFSIAVQLKLFCLVIIPLLLIQREWRKLFLGFLFLPLLSIGGVAVMHGLEFSLSENLEWVRSLTHSTDELILSAQNVGLLGTASKLLGIGFGKSVWVISGVWFLFYLAKNRGRSIAWYRDRLLYAVAIFNPLVWSYWILFAMPLFLERVRDFQLPNSRLRRGIIGVVVLFVFAAFNGQHAEWAWGGGIFLGLVAIGFKPILLRR